MSEAGAEAKAPPSCSAERRREWVDGVCATSSSGGDRRSAQAFRRCAAARWRRFQKWLFPVVRARPGIVTTALAVAALLAAVSAVGVVMAAEADVENRRQAALGFAQNTAAGMEAKLLQLMAPILAVSVLVRQSPSYPYQAARFYDNADELLAIAHDNFGRTGGRQAIDLRLAPQGVLRAIAPRNSSTQAAVGLDLLADPVRRASSLHTVQAGDLAIQGPVMLEPEGFVGIVMRLPIFVSNVTNPNESFGAPSVASNCPGKLCYHPETKTRFWGFAVSVADFGVFTGPGSGGAAGGAGRGTLLGSLEERGYMYALYAPQPGGGPPARISPSPAPLRDPVSAQISLPGNDGTESNDHWILEIAPRSGWAPAWRAPLLALVLVVSFALGALLLGLLVNRQQQAWLLRELKESNGALADEKRRTDVLLERQLHLINLLVDNHGRAAAGLPGGAANGGANGGGPGGPRGARRQELLADTPLSAREKIEELRRHVGAAAAASAPDEQLQLTELLGEGAFGKVYKGSWRGTTVAVKTMILPAKMSGAVKRERMAIMEAAISSAMNHPNIVQMYTYVIKPSGRLSFSGASGGPAGSTPTGSDDGGLFQCTRGVPNFEVSLVMEFCELGTLRDALDGGAFRTRTGGVNYAAVLDTAADVARALLHLHKQQVLHSDLKARNVLLKADGKSGRGAVAKVADFGLSMQIDPHTTHVSEYQGTPSHMPPEALLHGRVSKAGDVYSFGVTLYELFTGGHAYRNMPVALLGHKVSVEGLRPAFPSSAPADYRDLAAACWAPSPEDRPSFEAILERLLSMRRALGGKTERLRSYRRLTTTGWALPMQGQEREEDEHPDQRGARPLVGETIGEDSPRPRARPQMPPPPAPRAAGAAAGAGAGAGAGEGLVVVDFGGGDSVQFGCDEVTQVTPILGAKPPPNNAWALRFAAPGGAGAGGGAPANGGLSLDGAGFVVSFAASFFAKRHRRRSGAAGAGSAGGGGEGGADEARDPPI